MVEGTVALATGDESSTAVLKYRAFPKGAKFVAICCFDRATRHATDPASPVVPRSKDKLIRSYDDSWLRDPGSFLTLSGGFMMSLMPIKGRRRSVTLTGTLYCNLFDIGLNLGLLRVRVKCSPDDAVGDPKKPFPARIGTGAFIKITSEKQYACKILTFF